MSKGSLRGLRRTDRPVLFGLLFLAMLGAAFTPAPNAAVEVVLGRSVGTPLETSPDSNRQLVTPSTADIAIGDGNTLLAAPAEVAEVTPVTARRPVAEASAGERTAAGEGSGEEDSDSGSGSLPTDSSTSQLSERGASSSSASVVSGSSSAAAQAPATVAPATTAAPTTTVAPRRTVAPTTTAAPASNSAVLGAVFVSPDGVDSPGRGGSASQAVRTLNYAVSLAKAGDTINVLPGRYEPMVISGRTDLQVVAPEGGVTLSSGSYELAAGVLIEDSSQIKIEGLRVERSLWGLRVAASQDIVLKNNSVFDVGQEAIHILEKSRGVRIQGNRVDGTGRRPGGNGEFRYADFGEGIYLGTGGFLSAGVVDDVSDVQIIGNHVSNTTAEAVEIKASVFDVVVRDNTIHDVDVHSGGAIAIGRQDRTYDANVVVERNAIWNVTTRNAWADGVAIRVSSPATVRDNVIFNTEHSGVRVDSELRNVSGSVSIDNNLIFDTGLEAIVDQSQSTGVPVSISGTITGNDADRVLADLGLEPGASSTRALIEFLRNR